MIGPVEMVLYAASSAKDTDFIVRLCDVHPDGRSIFVTEGILRARYRNSHEGDSTELLEPGEVAEYRIRCYPAANVFKQGHRVRLDVTSSSFPRFSRNLNTGEDVGTSTRMEVARADGAAHGRLSVARRAARHPGVSDLFDLTGRTALVTGSTRGLGLALARALAGAGARVAINGRTREACEAAAAGIDGAFAAPFDVTDEDAVAAGVAALGRDRRAREQRGHADAAAARASSRSRSGSRCIDVNLTSAFLVARAVAPQMIERGRGQDRQHLLGDERGRPRDDRPVHGVEGRAEDADARDVRRLGARTASRRTASAPATSAPR